MDRQIGPGASAGIDLPAGPAAVRLLEISVGAGLPAEVREQVLRSVVLHGVFDDQPESIWCPVGEFEGGGAGGRPLQSWYRSVDESGRSVSLWTMPYRSSGKLTLENLSTIPIRIKLTASTGQWRWDDRSLYFHCDWRQQAAIPTRPLRDWNLDTMKGRGVLVGDVLSVYNRVAAWYGEGDERIWVDGEPFPSHLGTGTEDYYNASWAPNPVYQSPFANHPRIDDSHSLGQNVYTRTRNLDTVPFERSMQFDTEISTWQDSSVDYTTATYWYGSPGSRSSITPDPVEARRPVPEIPAPLMYRGAVECETAQIIEQSPGLDVAAQDMSPFDGGTWSARGQLFMKGKQIGDHVTLSIPVDGKGPCRLTLYATKASDYGIVRLSVNGQPAGGDFDAYSASVTTSGPIPLGVFVPVNGKIEMRVEVVGTNPSSTGDRYYAGLDAVVVN